MFKGHKFIAIVPARGGSKRIPHKNIREIAGKPLLQWTLEAAKGSAYIDDIVLSSDSDEILNVGKGIDDIRCLKRPDVLASDHASGMDPVFHVLDSVHSAADYVLLLQPTSPLRTSLDIDAFIEKMIGEGREFMVSVRSSKEIPTHIFFDQGGVLKPVVTDKVLAEARSQDVPKCFVVNGAIYGGKKTSLVVERSFFTSKTGYFEMPPERSIDIDMKEDFEAAEIQLRSTR